MGDEGRTWTLRERLAGRVERWRRESERTRVRAWRRKLPAVDRVEVLSVHIPKTAGGTFGATLAKVYEDELAKDYGKYGEQPKTLEGVRVVHGHFPVMKYLPGCPDAKVIVWFRNPVDRIASYYHYWRRRTDTHGNPNHEKMLREGMSLVEFAEMDSVRFEVPRLYLRGFDLASAWFVGMTEHYEQDFLALKTTLGWPKVRVAPKNVAPSPAALSPEVRKKLEVLLEEEFALYRRAMEMRKSRPGA